MTDDDGVECPTCGDTFASEQGMSYHHTTVHGESLIQPTECDHCGEEFTPDTRAKPNRFCSAECMGAAQRNRVSKECPECGEEFTVPASDGDQIYCSESCYGASMALDRERVDCATCGRTFSRPQHREWTHCCKGCEMEAKNERPRPDDPVILCWVLYEYEGFTVQETHERQRAHYGHGDALTLDDVREILDALGVKRAAGESKTIRDLRQFDADDVFDESPDGDDTWREYKQRGGEA